MKNKKAQAGWIVGVVLFLIVALLACFINGVGGSVGQHTGIITAVEHNNNLVWDANLVYFKSSDQSTQEDVYCVNDPDVMTQLKTASVNKTIVTIYFQNDFLFWVWDCNGGISIIEKVE